MNDPIEKLYDDLQEELILYADMGTPPVSKLRGALESLRKVLSQLRVYMISEPFVDEDSEIIFFKYEKPKFTCEQLYVVELATIQMSRPTFDKVLIKTFLENELQRITAFFRKYSFLHQCYQMDATDLDRLLFLRGAAPGGMLIPQPPDPDPLFSTNGDFLWAKFKAYERLQIWLVEELSSFDNSSAAEQNAGQVLKWTGESINLAELAYGIWLTGQVDYGNASVSEIVSHLERAFAVKIGDAHRRWQSIARRKRVGSFRFIDEMKISLEKRLEEEWGR